MPYNPFTYQPNFNAYQNYQQATSNIYWVQGLEGAKAYPVGAGNTVLLMDSDNQVMFIKSADQSGVPSLRIFDYTERTETKQDMNSYVTRKEFDELVEKLKKNEKTEKKKKVEEEDDDE